MLSIGFRLYQLVNVLRRNGEQTCNDRNDNLLNQLESQFKNYNKNVDRDVFEQLIELYGTKAPKELTPAAIQNINYSDRSEEHTSELQSRPHLVCRLLLEKKKKKKKYTCQIS